MLPRGDNSYGIALGNKVRREMLTRIANIIIEMSDPRIAKASDLFIYDHKVAPTDGLISKHELLVRAKLAASPGNVYSPSLFPWLCNYVKDYRLQNEKAIRMAHDLFQLLMTSTTGKNKFKN